MSTTVEIQTALESFLTENAKFEEGNGAAGTRARKALGDLQKLAKTRRVEIQDTKNARKA